jgi:hypothetical protein
MFRTVALLACVSVCVFGQSAGIQVNSTCEVGTCGSGVGTVTNTTAVTPFNFNYTFGDGDQYLITGSVTATDTGSSSFSTSRPFVVEYVGPTAVSVGTDVLSIQQYINFASTATSGSFNHSDTGQFAGTFGSGSSLTSQSFYGGNASSVRGPYTPPGSFNQAFTIGPFLGLTNPLLDQQTTTITFGSGSVIGAQVALNGASLLAPPTPPGVTPIPPSAALILIGLAGLGLYQLNRLRLQREN